MSRRSAGRTRCGNQFALLAGGRVFLSHMLAAIDNSRDYILAEFYLVESGATADAFVAALLRAAARGVRVRALFDGFGSRRFRQRDRQRMRAGGIDLVFFNIPRWDEMGRLFLRDHRKLLLVDGSVGFTGGAGITDWFNPDALPQSYWEDCMVEMRGPVLLDWHLLFARTWRRCQHRPLDIRPHRPGTLEPGECGRVASNSGLGRKQLARSVIEHIRAARARVWIATPYFWPSIRLRRALRKAAQRGLDVRLVLTGSHTDAPAVRSMSRLFYAPLLARGVVIYEYQQRFLHWKLVLCDDWTSIGSSNLDRWELLWNLDANQEIDSPQFARQVASHCVQICAQSTILRSPESVRTGWSAYFWRGVARLMLAWSQKELLRLRRLRGQRRSRIARQNRLG
jgi:phosphatidylserine/phosphatidylglycerophosphate/cardiolipin synthase-like enzyme